MNENKGAPIVSIVGRSNSGKTTLLCKLVRELKRREYRVGTVKHHSHPGVEVDKPGKDTWKHAQAGADGVCLVSPNTTFVVRNTPAELPLTEACSMLGRVDLVLTEGFRAQNMPKIEVVRGATGTEPLCSPEELVAIASDVACKTTVPCFGLDDIESLVDHILRVLDVARTAQG